MPLPNVKGVWRHMPTGRDIDIYPLDPVGGVLCLWGPDVGYMGDDPASVWDSDEWNGHIPCGRYDPDPDAWMIVRAPDMELGVGAQELEKGADSSPFAETQG